MLTVHEGRKGGRLPLKVGQARAGLAAAGRLWHNLPKSCFSISPDYRNHYSGPGRILIILCIIFLFVIFIYPAPIFSFDHSHYIRFKRITLADGLSQSSVTSIFKDDQGLMWFGTYDGASRASAPASVSASLASIYPQAFEHCQTAGGSGRNRV